MSAPGRPKREYRSAQHEGSPASLFVGITSWNSSLLLGRCLDAVERATVSIPTRVVVLDNASDDGSAAIAASKGAEVVMCRCTQPQALNDLFDLSDSEYTLLIHADVMLISPRWFELCTRHLSGNVAMIAPEDIGCGPYTRPWGKGMPESSFLLFRTAAARGARRWFRRRRFRIHWPYKAVDFFGEHITYNLPGMLAARDLRWTMMKVHTSPMQATPIYLPRFQPKYWQDSLAFYRYGLGNFYSIDGEITHYHNWFDRTLADSMAQDEDSTGTFPKEGGLPLAYVRAYTKNFIDDWDAGRVVLPAPGTT